MTNSRILIAGTEASDADDLKRMLVEMGYVVPGVAHSGEDVIEKAGELRPDLLLMDISPGGNVDAIEAAEKVCARFGMPVICLTDHSDGDVFRRVTMTEPFSCLSKPLDPARLHSAVELALLEAQQKESERLYRTVFEASGSAMMIVEENGAISTMNAEFERLSGYSKEAVENRKSWTEFLMGNGQMKRGRSLEGIDLHPAPPQGESLFFDRKMCEKTVCTDVRTIPGTRKWIVSIKDMTDTREAGKEIRRLNVELTRAHADLMRELSERRDIESELLHKANHDSLTGLPNRDLFLDRLKQAFAFAERHNSMFALMLLDLDNFKNINDTTGHLSGDILLRDVAKRLRECMRQYDTVARLGGDEFIVIVNDMKDMNDVARFAEKVRGLFRQPFDVNGEPMEVTVSIGVAVYPLHGANAETLLKKADMSMYQAKSDGKNAFRFFSYTMGLRSDERTVLKERLRAAFERKEFVLHYQPRVDAVSGKITGMEALLRWQPRGEHLVLPAEFFPSLEESGLTVPVGGWILDKVCRQNKAWQDAGFPPLRAAVNVSARQFRQESLPEKVAEVLAATGLDPCYLEIELTENTVMEDVGESISKLKKLKETGVTISIGNFGTGCSSLGCLNRLPIDELKIDRSLVNGITSGPNEAMVVSAAIAMGHGLGKVLAAEGVESEEQYTFLARHRCEEMQGYFFSRPLPSEEFEKLVRRGSGRWRTPAAEPGLA